MSPGSLGNFPDYKGPPPPLNDDRDENIQAFRTITTLLSWLPHRTPIEPNEYLDNLIENSNDCKAVKLADAFAQCVAVSEGDVAAVTSTRTRDRIEGTTALRVVVCVNAPSYDDDNEGVRLETSCEPKILIPSLPLDLGERHAFVYMEDLLRNWKKPSLADHLWILSNVLGPGTGQTANKQKPDVSTESLAQYIIAMSHHRIARRLNNPLSKAYIESLRQVKNIPPVSPSVRWSNTTVTSDSWNDWLFLIDFLKYNSINNPKRYKYNIENISKKIEALPDNPTNNDVKALQLYTDETAAEFHQLLLKLLDLFTRALDALVRWDTQDEATQGTEAAKKAFNKHSTVARQVGLALLWLSKGQVLKMHLENISRCLPYYFSLEIEDEERDAELEALMGRTRTTSLSGSKREHYIVWLRYIVSVGALLVPPMSASAPHAELLPWSALFDNEQKYIPDETSYVAIGVDAIKDIGRNKELKQILEEGIAMAEKGVQDTEDLRDASRDWEESQTTASCSTLRNYLEGLVSSNSDKEVQTHAKAIVTKLTHWTEFASAIPDSDHNRSQIAREVTGKIKAFHDVLLGGPKMSEYHCFFLRLRDISNAKFTGTLHSEACLASLLPAFTSGSIPGPADAQYKDIENLPNLQEYDDRIIGVSGLCCPICAQFLCKLNITREKCALVRGQHRTFSACSLPPWTPNDVIKKMNYFFGLRLRFDLQGFMFGFRTLRDWRKTFTYHTRPIPPPDPDSSYEWSEEDYGDP